MHVSIFLDLEKACLIILSFLFCFSYLSDIDPSLISPDFHHYHSLITTRQPNNGQSLQEYSIKKHNSWTGLVDNISQAH